MDGVNYVIFGVHVSLPNKVYESLVQFLFLKKAAHRPHQLNTGKKRIRFFPLPENCKYKTTFMFLFKVGGTRPGFELEAKLPPL